jgi:hypothetical protein
MCKAAKSDSSHVIIPIQSLADPLHHKHQHGQSVPFPFPITCTDAKATPTIPPCAKTLRKATKICVRQHLHAAACPRPSFRRRLAACLAVPAARRDAGDGSTLDWIGLDDGLPARRYLLIAFYGASASPAFNGTSDAILTATTANHSRRCDVLHRCRLLLASVTRHRPPDVRPYSAGSALCRLVFATGQTVTTAGPSPPPTSFSRVGGYWNLEIPNLKSDASTTTPGTV